MSVFFLAIISGNQILNRKIFLKRQFGLNLMFVKFLENIDRFNSELTDTSYLKAKAGDNWRSVLKKTRERLAMGKFRLISKRIIMAVACIEQEFSKKKLLKTKKINLIAEGTKKYFFLGLLIYGFLIIPFAIIAFFFTSGLDLAVKMLVLLVGYLFVCFLGFTIVEPLINLLIVKKVLEKLR
jgi:hypothetical protein